MTIFYLVCVLTQNNGFSTTKKVTFCVLEIGGEWMESQLLDAVQKNTFLGGTSLMGNYENPCVTKNNPILVVSLFFQCHHNFLRWGWRCDQRLPC